MNKIKLSGCVTIEPTYSHECFGEKFYEFYLQVLRKSGNADTLKCIIPEVLKDGISQFDAISCKFLVFEWHIIGVALFLSISIDKGFPIILLLFIIATLFPSSDIS